MKRATQVLTAAIGAGYLLTAGIVHAQTECSAPDSPTIPNGSAASEQELVDTVAAFKAYQQELAGFRECLTAQEAEYGEEITAQQRRRLIRDYNESVETEESLATELNEAIQDYRAANGG